MSDRFIGWSFVGAQAVLLIGLVLLPSRADFPLPGAARTMMDVTFWVGVAVALFAGLTLGRSLTASPVPNRAGKLRTGGLYALARHPIYTGVILIVVAMAVRSRSFVSLALALLTLVFFNVKAVWEERRLTDAYRDYPAYAARTPRFIPRLTRRARDRRTAG